MKRIVAGDPEKDRPTLSLGQPLALRQVREPRNLLPAQFFRRGLDGRRLFLQVGQCRARRLLGPTNQTTGQQQPRDKQAQIHGRCSFPISAGDTRRGR